MPFHTPASKQIMAERGISVPIITTLHGTDITIVGRDPSYKHVVEFSIDKSDGVTAVSDYLKKETYSHFDIKQDIRVIPNFIDLERFKKSNKSHFKKAICPEGEKVVVHVSNFRKVKRVPEVVSVFAKILGHGIKAKLLLVGDGPDRLKAEQQCRDLGICNHTRFLGKLDEVEEVLSMQTYFNSFRIRNLWACCTRSDELSVPVISSNIGGLPEVNIEGETGYLCHLDDIDCMAEHAKNILTDDALYNRLSDNARKRAEVFNQDFVVSQYEQFYEEVSAGLVSV